MFEKTPQSLNFNGLKSVPSQYFKDNPVPSRCHESLFSMVSVLSPHAGQLRPCSTTSPLTAFVLRESGLGEETGQQISLWGLCLDLLNLCFLAWCLGEPRIHTERHMRSSTMCGRTGWLMTVLKISRYCCFFYLGYRDIILEISLSIGDEKSNKWGIKSMGNTCNP